MGVDQAAITQSADRKLYFDEGKIMNLYSMVIEHVTKLLISEFVI